MGVTKPAATYWKLKHGMHPYLCPATGYDEMEATKAGRLLAHSLHLLLLSEFPPGSSVCPVERSETSNGDSWELNRYWPRNTMMHILRTAGQTERLDELKAKLQGEPWSNRHQAHAVLGMNICSKMLPWASFHYTVFSA